jgi:ketosteroid isomerase-like protein
MSEQQHIEAVRRGYEAFGRGDLDALLSIFHEDIEWKVSGPPDLPTAGTRRGHQQVREFFHKVEEVFDVQKFEPKTFVVDGGTVVVLGTDTARIKATGKVVEEDWVHVFTFRGDKVAHFREYVDTAAIVAELRGAQTPT